MSVRFAPSPTGKFHVGNLRTAWISHVFSRALAMPWVVRFEDIDRPRVLPGAQESQLTDVRALGLIPDKIFVQTEFHTRHRALFERAVETGAAYPCTCSRKELAEDLERLASAPHVQAPLYSGKCRDSRTRNPASHETLGWRFADPTDASGRSDFLVARTKPDRSDFVPAYHWACAIDDYDGEHLLLVRAWDLASATPVQKKIFNWVARIEKREKTYPAVFHTSLVVSELDGKPHRLEKRTRGVTLPEIISSGISVQDLVARFQSSFDSELVRTYAPGRIWGEKLPELDLRDFL